MLLSESFTGVLEAASLFTKILVKIIYLVMIEISLKLEQSYAIMFSLPGCQEEFRKEVIF